MLCKFVRATKLYLSTFLMFVLRNIRYMQNSIINIVVLLIIFMVVSVGGNNADTIHVVSVINKKEVNAKINGFRKNHVFNWCVFI